MGAISVLKSMFALGSKVDSALGIIYRIKSDRRSAGSLV